MSYLIRRFSLILLSLGLLALPAAAQAKTSAASYKKAAKVVNQTHKQWVSLRGPAVNEARKAGQQVADKCLPAFTAAGKLGLDSDVPSQLANAYWAVQNGASSEVTKPLRTEMQDGLAPLGGNPGALWWEVGAMGVDGLYMTPEEICSDTEAWQAAGFAESATPRSIDRAMSGFWLYSLNMSGRPVQHLIKQLRKNGASRSALKSFEAAYMVDVPNSDQEPVMKALFPNQDAT